MSTTSRSLERFDFDELASGAIKGWLLVTILVAIWAALDSRSDFLGVMLFEGRLSLWLLVGLVCLGLPCVSVLSRHWMNAAPLSWAIFGLTVFSMGFAVFATLFRRSSALRDLLVELALSGVFGGISFYVAKKQSDAARSAA